MRIAFLGPAPPFRGGIANFAVHLADVMACQGHTVQYFNFRSQYPTFLFTSGSQYDNSESRLPSIRVLTPYMPNTWQHAVKAINDWHPDKLLVSWWLPYFSLAYGYILRRMKCEVVILAHNILPHEAWPGTKMLLRYAFRPAGKIVVLSRTCLKDLQRTLPNEISRRAVLGFHPVYESVHPKEHPPQAFPGLLFFGLIKDYKGLDVLLKAMPIIRTAIPDIKLRIVGSVYGSTKKYESLIRELDLGRNVKCHFRYVNETEVAQFFAISDVCILPYKSATQSGVIATAFSYETPVIASDVGGLGEYVEHNRTGLLVPPNNAPALADAVIRYYCDSLMESFREAIIQMKGKNTWGELANLILH